MIVPPLVVLAATALAELLTLLLAPGYAFHHLHSWAVRGGGELLYNALLAVPVSLLLRRLRVGQAPEDPFRVR